jgi:hypothetical protein
MQSRYIGGLLGIEEITTKPSEDPGFFDGSHLCLTDARSGIWLLVELLSPKTVWMPSFVCKVMIEAVEKAGVPVCHFELDYDMRMKSSDWTDQVQPNDLVIFLDYMGYPSHADCANQIREKKAWILDDASQAWPSNVQSEIADFTLYSPRKFLGLPDGAVLCFQNHSDLMTDVNLDPPPQDWIMKSLAVVQWRRDFDRWNSANPWQELFKTVNDTFPLGPYQMSTFSQMMMTHGINFQHIATRRNENYVVLNELLRDIALFPKAHLDIVPLGFPIRVRNREGLQAHLLNHNVASGVHWNLQGVIPTKYEESHRLSKDIITLPCDQRYNEDDMNYMAEIIRKYCQ